jgi:UDP-glucose 6-dehydrogenase
VEREAEICSSQLKLKKAIDAAQVIFISVNTPTKTYGKRWGWLPI